MVSLLRLERMERLLLAALVAPRLAAHLVALPWLRSSESSTSNQLQWRPRRMRLPLLVERIELRRCSHASML